MLGLPRLVIDTATGAIAQRMRLVGRDASVESDDRSIDDGSEPDYFLDNDPDLNDSFDLNANRVGRDLSEGLTDRDQCLGPCSEFGFKFP